MATNKEPMRFKSSIQLRNFFSFLKSRKLAGFKNRLQKCLLQIFKPAISLHGIRQSEFFAYFLVGQLTDFFINFSIFSIWNFILCACSIHRYRFHASTEGSWSCFSQTWRWPMSRGQPFSSEHSTSAQSAFSITQRSILLPASPEQSRIYFFNDKFEVNPLKN